MSETLPIGTINIQPISALEPGCHPSEILQWDGTQWTTCMLHNNLITNIETSITNYINDLLNCTTTYHKIEMKNLDYTNEVVIDTKNKKITIEIDGVNTIFNNFVRVNAKNARIIFKNIIFKNNVYTSGDCIEFYNCTFLTVLDLEKMNDVVLTDCTTLNNLISGMVNKFTNCQLSSILVTGYAVLKQCTINDVITVYGTAYQSLTTILEIYFSKIKNIIIDQQNSHVCLVNVIFDTNKTAIDIKQKSKLSFANLVFFNNDNININSTNSVLKSIDVSPTIIL